ncbi:PP2C family protein-serine/threonine phosphatase [Streptomyces sp. NPDC058964]|uniref:PP2C family protein-serine/threonine phosphatase n=1 Tax=Streptomyces sp. NPDC058964 TaxID=3346681 RepID=UPI003674554F
MDEYDVDEMLQLALDRLTVLADINSALAGTMDATEGLRRVCRIVAHRVGDWCAIDLLSGDNQIERISVGRKDTGPRFAEQPIELPKISDSATGPLARVLRGAGPLLLTRTDLYPDGDLEGWDAAQALVFADQHATSAVIAPLRARREVLGAVTVTRFGSHPPLTEDTLPLIENIVHRIGLAIDNARLHRETERIAERLQRSLLPELPRSDHLTMAARYAPSHATAQVGGDWYDSFPLPTGDTTLIIGDVTGHDLKAAVTMSYLRNMLRGIASDRQEPPDKILHRLDLAQHTLYPDATATCIYAIIRGPEGGPWQLDYARAGHPPPLLVTHQGDTRYLDGGHSLPLGVSTEVPRSSATEPLPARCTVLLYTDGLIERRDEAMDRSLTRLRQHAAALAGEAPDTFCDELITGLAPDGTDDVALLAVRLPQANPCDSTGR